MWWKIITITIIVLVMVIAGEVGWLPEEGLHLYWRGHIEQVEYEYTLL